LAFEDLSRGKKKLVEHEEKIVSDLKSLKRRIENLNSFFGKKGLMGREESSPKGRTEESNRGIQIVIHSNPGRKKQYDGRRDHLNTG